jgi:hypothetical protein
MANHVHDFSVSLFITRLSFEIVSFEILVAESYKPNTSRILAQYSVALLSHAAKFFTGTYVTVEIIKQWRDNLPFVATKALILAVQNVSIIEPFIKSSYVSRTLKPVVCLLSKTLT